MPHHRPLRPQPLSHFPLPTLVLLTLGTSQDPTGPTQLLPVVANRLGGLTGLPLASIPDPSAAASALARLTAEPAPWLAPLPLDPGLWLPGGSWAEALGAWRQPSLLAFSASQLATGMPAAATALLQRWNVPLAGLIQWEGSWDGASRRADGLPWLGRLGPEVQVRPGTAAGETRGSGPWQIAAATGGPDGAGWDLEGPDPEADALALRAALGRRCARLLAELAAPPLA